MISVQIGPPDAAMSEEFDALAHRAAPNVFMHPAALCAAAATGFARIHVLQAFAHESEARKLVGFWALRERRVAPFWRLLAAPPYEYAFVSNPVIDPEHQVMPAFLDAIAGAPELPKVIRLKLIDGGADSFAPMMAALNARGGQLRELSRHTRPYLAGAEDRKRSGSTAKKLRQDWTRLATLGAVDVANERGAADVRAAFEVFLELEARSWKGQNGTALLSDDEDAGFARALVGNLAERGNASVALLRVDGRPVAAQVLLYAGSTAYTWKTAFDAEFAKFSPGLLLVDKVTDALLATGITQIESCSSEDSFLNHLWTGRRATVDLLVDVGERSPGFALVVLGDRAYLWLREWRDRLRAAHWLPARRKNLAVTRG